MADLSRPGSAAATTRVPLAERDPARLWQGVSALLAVTCLILILAALLVG